MLPGGGGSANIGRGDDLYHGVISSMQSNVGLSSLVQAIAHHVVHQFGAFGALYSVLCWSFSSKGWWCQLQRNMLSLGLFSSSLLLEHITV